MKKEKNNDKIPLHIQAEQALRELIEKEEYRNGKLLPPEMELCRQLGMSRNTLRQAVERLTYEGLLVRKKGVGTKVSRKGILVGVKNWMSFSQEMRMLGINVKNYELHISYKEPTAEIASFFEIDIQRKCLVLERLRGNSEYPFVLFVSYFNPELPLTGEENFSMPLYDLLNEACGVKVKTSREVISARTAGETVAAKLGIAPSDPILIRKRCVYDEAGIPIEYNIGYYRSDSFSYSIESTI